MMPSRTLFTHFFCLALSHACQSRRISRFKCVKYIVCTRTKHQSAAQLTWRDTTRDIIFRHPRKWLHLTGCFWCAHVRGQGYTNKFSATTRVGNQLFALFINEVIARTGPRWDIAMSRDLRYVTPISSEKEQKDSIERIASIFFLHILLLMF